MKQLIGPFSQLLTMRSLPLKGAISDQNLEVLTQAGVLCSDEGLILAVGSFEQLRKENPQAQVLEIEKQSVAMPGLIDCHSHACFAGSRAKDYALRVGGKSYSEILAQGGGIYDTVDKTRQADKAQLCQNTLQAIERSVQSGVTTLEIKSGYGLNVEQETKMLSAIALAQKSSPISLIATCLAAHVPPKEIEAKAYLEHLGAELLPFLSQNQLCSRVDIFVEEHAFGPEISLPYLLKAKELGFSLTIHADQFSVGGSRLAVEVQAASADHLEASGAQEIELLAQSQVVAVVLPGASLGLGINFAPARKLLDAGCCLAVASDFNPGSAPNGDLLSQAAFLGAAQKLTLAETLAALTTRAAQALKLQDRGKIDAGYLADITAFPTDDYREILYWQGRLRPDSVWCKAQKVL
jgi:imidazolonepropionase